MSKCLFSKCPHPGTSMGIGYGFTFCAEHEERARTVMSGGPLVEAPRPARKCRRGHIVVGPNVGNAGKCRACANANSIRTYRPDVDREVFAEQRYRDLMAGTKWARTKVSA